MFIAFLAGLPLLLIAGLIRWRLQWLKDYQAKLASQVGQLRNDTQLHTPKAILIDLIRALPVVLVILAIGLILLTMQLNISGLLWAYSKKLAMFWLVFGLCWKVLEKNGVAVSHFNMPAQLTSHWRRQIVRVSLALLPLNFWSVISELSPLNLMDDVLGQFVIFFNLLLIAVLVWPMCRESWRDKESHSLRLLTIHRAVYCPGSPDGADGDRLLLHHAAPGGTLDRDRVSGDDLEPAVPDRAARSGAWRRDVSPGAGRWRAVSIW